MQMKDVPGLLRQTWDEFNADKAPRLGAALAYYTVFSLAPLLVITIAIASFFLDEATARTQLVSQARDFLGPQVADVIAGLIDNATQPSAGVLATVISVVTVLLAASGVFGELQGALNTIWGVEVKAEKGLMAIIRPRLQAFALVLGVGFLLLAAIAVTSTINILARTTQGLLPGAEWLWSLASIAINLLLITFVFAAIFKVVPDAKVTWHEALVGGAVTAVLFFIGRFLLGLYLSNASTTSVYGAAGSLALLLLWVFYSAQILFLGAEFTQVYARAIGQEIRPSEHAYVVQKRRPGEKPPPAEAPAEAAGDQARPPRMREVGRNRAP